VLTFTGKRPGAVGRKLSKKVVKLARLLLSDLSIEVPVAELSDSGDAPILTETRPMRIDDRVARQLLAHTLECKTDKASIAEAVASQIPELYEGMMAIFTEFSKDDERVEHYHVNNFNHHILDAITHLMSASSIEGYVRSSQGALAVSGYKSYARRLYSEGIDSSAEDRLVDPYERAIWDEILSHMTVPSMRDMYLDLKELSNSKSGGGDRVRFKVDRGVILGKGVENLREGFSSNRKDTMHLTAHLIVREHVPGEPKPARDYMMIRSSPDEPFPTGQRSVPGRELRYIYNLPIPQQLTLSRMYKAMKDYMAHAPGYSLAQKEGIPIHDAIKEINASILLAHNENLISCAIDASALDQHIGRAHRRVQMEAISAHFGDRESPEIERGLGHKYADMLLNTIQSWDESYYHHSVPGSPSQLLKVDTQPSGALTTAVDNSLTTMGMLHMMEAVTGITQLRREVWGDDTYIVINPGRLPGVVDTITRLDELGKEAGQELGTVEDSTSGRSVHYLQKVFVGGQIFQRRMAYDHENEVMGDRMPGSIGEFLDKARDLSTRGGNKTLLNMLQLLTVINGSRATQFGRQASASFDTMAAPGGLNNRLLVGFASPNSKLYLELNATTLFGASQVEIQPRPVLEKSATIGKRVLDHIADSGPVGSQVTVNIGGVEETHNIDHLRKGARRVLLDEKRFRQNQKYVDNLHKRAAANVGNGASHLSYLNSIENGASMSVGDVLVNKHLRPMFREKALIKSNYIASTLEGKPEPQEMKMSSTHTGFKIGSQIIKFGFSTKLRLQIPKRSNENFILYEGSQIKLQLPQKWHPYYGLPRHYRMTMSLFGVTPSAQSQVKIKTFMNKFSPGHFRSDLTAEEVVNALKKTKSKEDQIALLEHIGFTQEEIQARLHFVKDISLYEDFSTAEEYSSVPDIVKSCATITAEQLLFHSAGESYMVQADEVRRIVISHFISLIVDELNIACSLHSSQSRVQTFIRLPTVEVST
jgi:hypothetical protein